MADDDSTEPNAPDPANLAEALPDSDRGQGTISPSPSSAIAQAAAEGVNLTDDGTGLSTGREDPGSANG